MMDIFIVLPASSPDTDTHPNPHTLTLQVPHPETTTIRTLKQTIERKSASIYHHHQRHTHTHEDDDEELQGISAALQRLTLGGRYLHDDATVEECAIESYTTLHVLLPLLGGIDFQNRDGSRFGGGGQMSESLANADRRERLRKLALETIDLNKDPYFMRNHLGSYECKLCLTLHNNEGNYLAHTQGKRHQENLARRAAKEAKEQSYRPQKPTVIQTRRSVKIGRPGYKVTKARDLQTRQRSLIFEIDYPEAEADVQPRHRFMSAFEQRVETANKQWQYLLFACEPYETIGFKIPNIEIDKGEKRFYTHWDDKSKKFILQLYFREVEAGGRNTPTPGGRRGTPSPQKGNYYGGGGGGGGGEEEGEEGEYRGGGGGGGQQQQPPPPPPRPPMYGGPANMVPPPPPPPRGGGY